jgi:hypothetical protein
LKDSKVVVTLTLMLLVASTMLSAKATAAPNVIFSDFHVVFHINQNPYSADSYQYSFVAMVHDTNDQAVDHQISGVTDANGNLLVDLVFVDANGEEFSTTNGQMNQQDNTYWQSFETQDLLWFAFSAPSVTDPTKMPLGTYKAELRTLGTEETILSISLDTPYEDSNGNLILPLSSPKFPSLSYPQPGQTILDTTPTFKWQYPTGVYQGDHMQFSFGTWWTQNSQYYQWNTGGYWDPPFGTISATFPNAPEHPEVPPTEIVPPGGTFQSELPVGQHWYQLVATEWFFNIGGNPACYFITPYSTMNFFYVAGKPTITIDPQTLNLASNGKWVTAHIELPNGYSVNQIDPSSIRINGVIPIDDSFTPKVGYNSNGITDLTVKFDRAAIANLLSNIVGQSQGSAKFYNAQLTISGNSAGTPFASICAIKVIQK